MTSYHLVVSLGGQDYQMRIFKHRFFSRWAEDEKISDLTLKKTITELSLGLFEANLGGNIYKKRIARRGQGKRASYRTLIAFKQNDRAVFVLGFSKGEKTNINQREKEGLKRMANNYIDATDENIRMLLRTSEIIEVK